MECINYKASALFFNQPSFTFSNSRSILHPDTTAMVDWMQKTSSFQTNAAEVNVLANKINMADSQSRNHFNSVENIDICCRISLKNFIPMQLDQCASLRR